MPKSISSIQLQVTGCEQAIQQAIDLFVYMAEGQDVRYSVDLQNFIQNISTLNVKAVHRDITKAIDLFQEVQRIISLEKKRRKYVEEMEEALQEKEKKEDLKKMTRRMTLKRKAQLKVEAAKAAKLQEAIPDEEAIEDQ